MPLIDITDEVVQDLGYAYGVTNPGAVVPASLRWDCSIGGLPFLFGMSDQLPMRRETSEFRRQRIDSERNPGEQSLDSGYWIRSQSSWHYGDGLTSAEPLEINDLEARFRYQEGGGIDPWTPGQLSLLHDTEKVFSASATGQLLLGVNTGVLHAAGTALSYLPSAGASASVSWSGSATIQSLTSNGSSWFVGANGGIYKGTLPSGAGTHIYTTAATTLVRWVKSRLMASVGTSIYEITNISPSATPAALPTALYTHPSTDWVWTDFAEGPTAIYLSGYSGDSSSIFQIGVDATSTTVTLAQPVVVAEMPRGEVVKSLYSYVGAYMIVGTSKGVRVAAIESNGSLTLGPLLIEKSDGCDDAVAQGSFVWVTVGAQGDAGNRVNRAGLYRVNLGQNLNNSPLQFAHASDLVAPAGTTGKAVQVSVAGDAVWFAVDGSGVFREKSTFVSEGWLETGRIRLGTVEAKAWRDMRLMMLSSAVGSVTGYASVNGSQSPSTWDQVINVTSTNADQYGSLNYAAPGAQQSLYAAFKITATDPSISPVMVGYQLRAIPAPKRTELVQATLLCMDFETDRTGVRYGAIGGAWSRFSLLKDLERSSGTVTWLDYTTGERAEAYVERVVLTRTMPPSRQHKNGGGLAQVLLRLV